MAKEWEKKPTEGDLGKQGDVGKRGGEIGKQGGMPGEKPLTEKPGTEKPIEKPGTEKR